MFQHALLGAVLQKLLLVRHPHGPPALHAPGLRHWAAVGGQTGPKRQWKVPAKQINWCIVYVFKMYLWCIDNVYVSCASHLCFPHNMYWRCIWLDYSSVLVMYLPCNTSQYIIEVLGCITGCIVMYPLMYWDVFGEVFWFMCRMGIHPNTADNTSQYIVEYIIIPLKYIPIHLWCIEMLIHPKNIWYIRNTSQYIPIHRVHPPRFANVGLDGRLHPALGDVRGDGAGIWNPDTCITQDNSG